jgi:hypothetical protein
MGVFVGISAVPARLIFLQCDVARVEYQLSFENYLEMHGSRSEKPSYRLGLGLALAGFALFSAGYTYLRFSPPENLTFIGGILLASGLLCTFAAGFAGFLAKPKSRKANLDTLRREYELYGSDPRVIEFDDKGWSVAWYEGVDVRPWLALRAVHELNSLLVLSTTGTPYWLPRSALDAAGELAELKALVLASLDNSKTLFTVPVRPSVAVYVLASFFDGWRRNLRLNLVLYLFASILLYWILFSGWLSEPASSAWFLCLPLLYLFCEGLFYVRRYYTTNWKDAAQEASVKEDCLGYHTPKANWISKFQEFKDWREIPGTFLLYIERAKFHFIPKSGMPPEQIQQIREILNKYINSGSRRLGD